MQLGFLRFSAMEPNEQIDGSCLGQNSTELTLSGLPADIDFESAWQMMQYIYTYEQTNNQMANKWI